MHQGEGVDAGVVVPRVGPVSGRVTVDRRAQQRVLVCGIVPLLCRCLVVAIPGLRPGILVDATKERPRFGITRIGDERAR